MRIPEICCQCQMSTIAGIYVRLHCKVHISATVPIHHYLEVPQ